MGVDAAERMLGQEGWVVTAAEAKEAGILDTVVYCCTMTLLDCQKNILQKDGETNI